MTRSRLPPTGKAARACSLVSLVLPIMLPVAVVLARRARGEAAASAGGFLWPQRLVDRPIIFWVVTWVVFLVVVFVETGIAAKLFDVSPV